MSYSEDSFERHFAAAADFARRAALRARQRVLVAIIERVPEAMITAHRGAATASGRGAEPLLVSEAEHHPRQLAADVERAHVQALADLADARAGLADAQAAKAEAEAQLIEARGAEADADAQLVEARAELAQAHTELTQAHTELTQAQIELAEARATDHDGAEPADCFTVAFDQAPIGMAVISLDGLFERVNESICELTGYSSKELETVPLLERVYPEDCELIEDEFISLGSGNDAVTVEHRITHAAGHAVWVKAYLTLIRDAQGRPLHTLAQFLDLTERNDFEQRIAELATRDPLTGLHNRRGFEEALGAHLARCHRNGVSGTLLGLDLDGFKLVNDTLGTAAGDDLIVRCAHALKTRLRETDTIARLGGDEFAVLLPEQNGEEAETVARDIVETVRECMSEIADSLPGRVTVSLGVAAFPDPVCTADEMLLRANHALYSAKDFGKDQYALYRSDTTGGQHVTLRTA